VLPQRARNANSAGRNLVLEAAQTAALTSAGVAATNDAAKYTWFENPRARVEAIFTGERFLGKDEAATPALEVVRAAAAGGDGATVMASCGCC
jgi:hypothetical protein